MILEKTKNLDIQTVGEVEEGLSAGIDEENLPIIFDMVSKNLYSDPIGSVIREITSNGFDGHRAANNTTDPVIVSYGTEPEEGMYIQFQDFGTGMSPDLINQVYRNYFSSTKRGTNNEIGGWGLGSKTPLAYTEMFYITTVVDGFKYEYLYHKGTDKPKIESIYGWNRETRFKTVAVVDEEGNATGETKQEPYVYKTGIGVETEDRNGTTIRVIIKDRYDKDKFTAGVRYQLAYFDNVFLKGWGLPNDFRVYNKKNFIYRSDMDGYATETHLVVGKVRYPINFNKIQVPAMYKKIPIAVKFDIGELPVTLSREEVEYNDKVIPIITARVKAAGDELIEMYSDQSPEIDDLHTWRRMSNETPVIWFDKEKGDKINLWAHSGIEKQYKFKPLREIGLKYAPNNLFFMWECVGYIDGGIRRSIGNYSHSRIVDIEFILTYSYLLTDNKANLASTYTDMYIGEQFPRRTVYLIKRKEIDYTNKEQYEALAKELKIQGVLVSSKAKTIMGFNRKILEIVKGNAGKKDGKISYTDYKATDQWIADYKRSIIESTAAWQRKKANKIFFRYPDGGSNEMTEYEFGRRTGILVYGFKEDKEVLNQISRTITDNRDFLATVGHRDKRRKSKNSRQAFMVIIIAKAAKESVKGAKKTYHWEDFLKRGFFRLFYTAYLARQVYNTIKTDWYREKFLPNFYDEYRKLNREISKYSSSQYSRGFHVKQRYLEDIKPIPGLVEEVTTFRDKYNAIEIPLRSIIRDHLNREELKPILHLIKAELRMKNYYYLKTDKQIKEMLGVREIIRTIKNYSSTIKQLQYVNIEDNNERESDESIRLEDSGMEDGFNNGNGISGGERGTSYEESDNGAGGCDFEESQTVREETYRQPEGNSDQIDDTGVTEEESGSRESSSSDQGLEIADQESGEEIYF